MAQSGWYWCVLPAICALFVGCSDEPGMGPTSGPPADVASESDTTGVADAFVSDTAPEDITDTSAPSDAQAPRVDITTLDDVLEDATDIELSDAILLDTLDGAEL